MDWSDEHFVKLYTRDTATWKSWPWQARAVFPLLMRKLDGAGLMAYGRLELSRAIAVMIEVPEEVVAPAVDALIADGTIERVSSGLLVPKFLEAQEARKTDKRKSADYRANRRAVAKAAQLLEPPVTPRHTALPSCPALPSPAQLPPSEVVAPAPPKSEDGPAPPQITEPPADKFADARSFWIWFQFKRHQVQLVTEKLPNPKRLSAWWSEVHLALGGDPTPLERAVHRFAVDKHWETADPPLPFNAFMSQWRNYARAA